MRILGDNYSIGDWIQLVLSIGALAVALILPEAYDIFMWWLLVFLQGWVFVDLVSTRTTKVYDAVLASAIIYTLVFTIYRWLLNDFMKALIGLVMVIMITNFILIFLHICEKVKNRIDRYMERKINNE